MAPNYLNSGEYPELVAPGTHGEKDSGLVLVTRRPNARGVSCLNHVYENMIIEEKIQRNGLYEYETCSWLLEPCTIFTDPSPYLASKWSLRKIVNHCGIHSVISSGFATCLAPCVFMWQNHYKSQSEC